MSVLTIGGLFERELSKLIEDEVARVAANVIGAGGIGDFAEYMRQVGYLSGLRKCAELFEEANANISKRERT